MKHISEKNLRLVIAGMLILAAGDLWAGPRIEKFKNSIGKISEKLIFGHKVLKWEVYEKKFT